MQGNSIFFLRSFQTVDSGVRPSSCPLGTRDSFPEAWRCTCIFPYGFMACVVWKRRDNVTYLLRNVTAQQRVVGVTYVNASIPVLSLSIPPDIVVTVGHLTPPPRVAWNNIVIHQQRIQVCLAPSFHAHTLVLLECFLLVDGTYSC
jgi:hypothetical protein